MKKNQTVCVVREGSVDATVLSDKLIKGITDTARAYRDPLQIVYSPEQIDFKLHTGAVIVAGTREKWVNQTVKELCNINCKVVLAGTELFEHGMNVSTIGISRQKLIDDMVKHFYSFGKHRLATIVHSSLNINDMERARLFLAATKRHNIPSSDSDIYIVDENYQTCFGNLIKNIDKYDGVICTNDYVAVLFLRFLRYHNINVPDKLSVAGSGNMYLGRYTNPTLTTTTLDYYNIGVQSVKACKTLNQDHNIETINICVPSNLVSRQSTDISIPSQDLKGTINYEITDKDPMKFLKKLEECLQNFDASDYKILGGILQGKSISVVAGEVYASVGTIQYRLNKIYKSLSISSRVELENLVSPYLENISKLYA